MALIDDFKARFPNFAPTTVDSVLPTLEYVWPFYYGGSYLNDFDKEIILNLLAHLFVSETSGKDSSIKDVASKSVGSVSVSYIANSQQNSNTDFFSSSKYGQRYLMLTQKNMGGYFV